MKRIQSLNVKQKTVLLRVDFNVPMRQGRVEDASRVERIIPTIEYLLAQKAKVVILSHCGRPKGEFVREFSLAPLADVLGKLLGNMHVKFAIDCIGESAKASLAELLPGEVLLLENLRFHPEEEANDPKFAKALAALGDVFVCDTFSCAHRAHASIVGITKFIPSAAGLLLQEEVDNLTRVLASKERPIAAITGGAKVSTKLQLLHSLREKTDFLVIGGAMANTFLAAQGYKMGKSLYEKDLIKTAKEILKAAQADGCELILPVDVVVAQELTPHASCRVIPVDQVGRNEMILDIGPKTVSLICDRLEKCKTLVWNGPLGAFEVTPFDVSTTSVARMVASLTTEEKLISIAGGGDVVAAIHNAGVADNLTYISTAGGAFLEWLEGRTLPGIAALS